jgi:hypothetical protein
MPAMNYFLIGVEHHFQQQFSTWTNPFASQVDDKFGPIKLYRIHLTMMTLYTSIYLNSDLSLAPLYWCVAMWKMWRNHSTGHMRVTLCHDPVHLMKKDMMENKKLLGVHIDQTQSWETHTSIEKLCSIICVWCLTPLSTILVISWWSVLLVQETGVHVPRKNHRPVASHWQTLSHKVVSNTPRHEWDSKPQL